MRALVVEDDFRSRKLLQRLLAPYGECDISVNGKEALKAFRLAVGDDQRYDLVCLDIMMPEMDGHTVLEEIRKMEKADGILGLDGVKIIMTTALSDAKSIMRAFKSQCEAYLIKPIDKEKLLKQLQTLGLLEKPTQ